MSMTLTITESCTDIAEQTGSPDGAPWMRFGESSSPLERRRGLRVQQARPVKVYEPAGARYYGGQTEDVSVTGLRVELPASAMLFPGKVINVHVGLDPAGRSLPNRRQLIPARVVWVDRTFARGVTLAGIEFVTSIAAHLDAA